MSEKEERNPYNKPKWPFSSTELSRSTNQEVAQEAVQEDAQEAAKGSGNRVSLSEIGKPKEPRSRTNEEAGEVMSALGVEEGNEESSTSEDNSTTTTSDDNLSAAERFRNILDASKK